MQTEMRAHQLRQPEFDRPRSIWLKIIIPFDARSRWEARRRDSGAGLTGALRLPPPPVTFGSEVHSEGRARPGGWIGQPGPPRSNRSGG
jgi:hypothetical protein